MGGVAQICFCVKRKLLKIMAEKKPARGGLVFEQTVTSQSFLCQLRGR